MLLQKVGFAGLLLSLSALSQAFYVYPARSVLGLDDS